jgi:23S rRNA pseudouridine1911/1915/1917 synthase
LVLGKVAQEDQVLQNLMKRAEFNRKKFVVNQKKGKSAVTRVQVIQREKNVSFVRALPETGRTHQIRVHLSFIGHPILGDDTYGCTLKKLAMMSAEDREFVRALTRPLLHAHRLCLIHPGTKKEMEFCVPMPEDMRVTIHRFWPNWKIPKGY